jgi:hypothetical protein
MASLAGVTNTQIDYESQLELKVGWISHIDNEDRLWVDFPGNCSKPVVGQVLVSALREDFKSSAYDEKIYVLLAFEKADRTSPVVIGAIRKQLPKKIVQVDYNQAGSTEVVVDGEKIVLVGHKEIKLRCGKCSITLDCDGKVTIKGQSIVSQAAKRNSIKGGSVAIN